MCCGSIFILLLSKEPSNRPRVTNYPRCLSACGVRPEHHRAQPCANALRSATHIFTRYSPVTSQTGRRSPSQRNAARVNATVQPAKHGSGRASRRWFLLTGAILSARAHFSNPSLADACRRRRQRLCGAASNSAIAGPLLASLSKRRVASVFRLRLLGEARATRSVLHVKSVLRWRQSTAPPGTDRSRRVQVIRYLFEACRALIGQGISI